MGLMKVKQSDKITGLTYHDGASFLLNSLQPRVHNKKSVQLPYGFTTAIWQYDSGGSRNLERGVQQVGWHIHSARAPPKALRRDAKRRSVRAKRGNFLFYVFFLAIRKRSRSISAHSGHVPRRKED